MAVTAKNLFSTPLLTDKSEHAAQLNALLKPAILDQMEQDEGMSLSNVHGWHSKTDMVKWGGEAARVLIGHVMKLADMHTKDIATGDYDQPRHVWYPEAWANVNGKGALNSLHSHPGCIWSAVYYVDDGYDGANDPALGGILQLEDPRMPTIRMKSPDLRYKSPEGQVDHHLHDIRPESGLLVMFPSWLNHQVTPYNGDGQRISIAINLTDLPAEMAQK